MAHQHVYKFWKFTGSGNNRRAWYRCWCKDTYSTLIGPEGA